MVLNKELTRSTLESLSNFLINSDPSFSVFCDGEIETGAGIIEATGKINVSSEAKLRVIFGNCIGYGYDFHKEHDGEPAKDVYERAVKNTKEIGGRPGFETFVSEGIEQERFGWYITRL